ncbi:MAG: hypothetical protein GXP39_16355 [Chloroflexi bacterium]|nr:hypothetical protein [Chloroflexota bacterium]
MAIGDLDGDSQPDVVSGDDDYQVVAWQNDGTPFSSGWLSNTVGSRGDYITSVAMGDLDGDGQPDVVSGDEDNQVIAWQNPGAPFGDPWVPLVIYTAGDYVRSVALADLDNDGDLDIIAGSDDRSVIVCENTSATEIAGWVFIDSNGDGIRNPWPPDNETSGLSGVIIELWQGGTLVDTTHSVLPSGWYQFDVEPGDYIVREQQPAGYASTSPDEVAVSVSRGLHIVSFGEQAFTPTPTATSTPTATPTPTVTPTPTMTPTPTATPTATPSPTPTEEPLRTLYLPLILAE